MFCFFYFKNNGDTLPFKVTSYENLQNNINYKHFSTNVEPRRLDTGTWAFISFSIYIVVAQLIPRKPPCPIRLTIDLVASPHFCDGKFYQMTQYLFNS